VAPELA